MSAWSEGRTAKLRAANPYYGQHQLARMWMLGYKRMLRERLDRSPAGRSTWLASASSRSLWRATGIGPLR